MNTPILSVKDLSIVFKQGAESNQAVSNVSFDLYKGETFALVGESGSGKSVTAQSIVQLLPRSITEYPSGEVIYNDKDLLKCTEQVSVLFAATISP